MELSPVSNQIIIKLINTKLGIKDNNVQKLKLECMKKMIEKFPITRYLITTFLVITISYSLM